MRLVSVKHAAVHVHLAHTHPMSDQYSAKIVLLAADVLQAQYLFVVVIFFPYTTDQS
jgi:hypothetical protein